MTPMAASSRLDTLATACAPAGPITDVINAAHRSAIRGFDQLDCIARQTSIGQRSLHQLPQGKIGMQCF